MKPNIYKQTLWNSAEVEVVQFEIEIVKGGFGSEGTRDPWNGAFGEACPEGE